MGKRERKKMKARKLGSYQTNKGRKNKNIRGEEEQNRSKNIIGKAKNQRSKVEKRERKPNKNERQKEMKNGGERGRRVKRNIREKGYQKQLRRAKMGDRRRREGLEMGEDKYRVERK